MKTILPLIFLALLSILTAEKISGQVKDAEVYVVFFSVPSDLSAEIMGNLNIRCRGIKFSGGKIIGYDTKEGYEANIQVLREIEILKINLDGLIIVCGGFCDPAYLRSELPTLIIDCSPFKKDALGLVQPLHRGHQIGYNNAIALAERFETKFLTAYYPALETKSVAERELQNLSEKIGLFKIIKDLKNSRIVSIQDHKGYNRIDQATYDGPVTYYDLTYPDKLKEYFGIELIVVSSEELSSEMKKVDSREAEKVADKWIKEAKEVKFVQRSDIVRHAVFYLANKAVLVKYKAQAVSYDSSTLSGILQAVYPLIIMELSKENIPSHCQSHLDCLVTSLIGSYMTGYTGFTGDFLNDWIFEPTGERPENVMVIGHCGAPVRVYGHERLPYLITDHYIALHHDRAKEGNTPPAITVDFPPEEVATIGKIDVYRKQMSVVTGKVIDANALYKDWPVTSCRNKIAIRLDNPENWYMLPSNPNAGAFRQNFAWNNEFRHFGSHHTAFYGDIKKRFRDLGALIGFDVISN
jgi:hypothetical protein